jgi:ABC-type polar amino acid transport system ATPase subunit
LPDIMLFDEPTSALDPEMVGEVFIINVKEEGTLIIQHCPLLFF